MYGEGEAVFSSQYVHNPVAAVSIPSGSGTQACLLIAILVYYIYAPVSL